MVDARPVLLTAIGTDVFLLSVGKVTIALNYVEVQALTHAAVHATTTLFGSS